jgi:hypothetical protein
MDYTPIVLKNKGVPVKIAIVEKSENGTWKRRFNEEGEYDTETVYVRFNHNTIADIEERFGDLEEWQNMNEKRAASTVRETLSLCLRTEKEKIGEAMIEGALMDYQNAIAMAWSICNGVDPTTASRLLRQAENLAEEQRKAINAELESQLPKEPKPSRGKTGSVSGSKLVEP